MKSFLENRIFKKMKCSKCNISINLINICSNEYYCKSCYNKLQRLYRKINPEKYKNWDKIRYKKDPEKRIRLVNKYRKTDRAKQLISISGKRVRNTLKYKKWKKEYYLKNKEKIALKGKKYRKLNKEKLKSINLEKVYGISLEKYNKMYLKQQGSCKICKQHYKQLYIDHCHISNKVRALLCPSCNFGLGNFKEDINRMKRAIKYVAKFG